MDPLLNIGALESQCLQRRRRRISDMSGPEQEQERARWRASYYKRRARIIEQTNASDSANHSNIMLNTHSDIVMHEVPNMQTDVERVRRKRRLTSEMSCEELERQRSRWREQYYRRRARNVQNVETNVQAEKNRNTIADNNLIQSNNNAEGEFNSLPRTIKKCIEPQNSHENWEEGPSNILGSTNVVGGGNEETCRSHRGNDKEPLAINDYEDHNGNVDENG